MASRLKMELEAVIDRVALDMGYKSLKSKQKLLYVFCTTKT